MFGPLRRPRRVLRTRLALAVATAACLAAPAAAPAAPDTIIGSHPTVAANDRYARFDFTSNPPGAPSFECRLDGGAWTLCTSSQSIPSQSYSNLTDGTHTFDVRAVSGGEKDPTPATWSWPVEPITGMSIGLSNVNRGKYIWGRNFGTVSEWQVLGDVTGDGRDDAVVFNKEDGSWKVARSTHDGFAVPTGPSLTGFGTGDVRKALLGDVDNDDDEDIVIVSLAPNGATNLTDWYVAKSLGTAGFSPPSQTPWAQDFGAPTQDGLMLADVTGDGRDDAVAFANGKWSVRAANSQGSAFLPPGAWKSDFGTSTSTPFVGEVTGDTSADAIVYNPSNGNWDVAPSCFTATPRTGCTAWVQFGPSSTWKTGFGDFVDRVGTEHPAEPLVGDVGGGSPLLITGDGKADIVVYRNEPTFEKRNGVWVKTGDEYVWRRAMTNAAGTSFVEAQDAQGPPHWKSGHVARGTDWKLFLGNADGQMDDPEPGSYPPIDDPVIFERDAGDDQFGRWKFIPGEGKQRDQETKWVGDDNTAPRVLENEKFRPNSPVKWNRWEADVQGQHPNMSIDLQGWRPLAQSTAEAAYPNNYYDSFDAGVLDGQLEKGREARIDFLMMDETNDLNTGGGYLWNRAMKLCQRVKVKRAVDSRYPRIAAAVGGFGTAPPNEVLADAKQVYEDLATNDQCGATDSRGHSNGYMRIENKPLISLYVEPSYKADFKAATAPVTDGQTPYQWVKDKFAIRWVQGRVEWHPAEHPGTPEPPDYWDYTGTVKWDGSIPNASTMGVMPGWRRLYDDPRYVARSIGTDKQFYEYCGWFRVLEQSPRPDLVVITGYNGYGEQMAVVPTKAPASAGWYRNDTEPGWYWKKTVDWNKVRKDNYPGSGIAPGQAPAGACEN